MFKKISEGNFLCENGKLGTKILLLNLNVKVQLFNACINACQELNGIIVRLPLEDLHVLLQGGAVVFYFPFDRCCLTSEYPEMLKSLFPIVS